MELKELSIVDARLRSTFNLIFSSLSVAWMQNCISELRESGNHKNYGAWKCKFRYLMQSSTFSDTALLDEIWQLFYGPIQKQLPKFVLQNGCSGDHK